MAVLI